MKKIKLVVVQYKPHYLNVQKNLSKIERLIKKSLYFKPDFFILPEYSLTGPLYSNYSLAFENNSKSIYQICELAKKYNVNIVPGSFVQKKDGKKFNSTCLITSKGEILNYYNKQKLWAAEKIHLKPGVESTTYNHQLGKISLQICADLHSSKISDNYRRLKPDLIINTAMWSVEDSNSSTKKVPRNIESLQTEILAKARAIENRCYFIFCNFADKLNIRAKSGREYKETSIGNTMIINPFGEIIAKTSSNKEEILLTEIDLAKSHWSKYNY